MYDKKEGGVFMSKKSETKSKKSNVFLWLLLGIIFFIVIRALINYLL